MGYRENEPQAYLPIARASARIWHDSLRELRLVDTPLVDSQRKAIKAWKEFGEAMGLHQGVNVTTLKKPSIPSDNRRYWKIPKQCYYGPCVCSLPLPSGRPYHSLRVCKGCYRVLYCNERCQSLWVSY